MNKFKLILVIMMIALNSSSSLGAETYEIEVAHNDEFFIINDEKFEAQTYCLGWEEGDEVLFIEGSPYGACSSAELYNITKKESCNVWCE